MDLTSRPAPSYQHGLRASAFQEYTDGRQAATPKTHTYWSLDRIFVRIRKNIPWRRSTQQRTQELTAASKVAPSHPREYSFIYFSFTYIHLGAMLMVTTYNLGY